MRKEIRQEIVDRLEQFHNGLITVTDLCVTLVEFNVSVREIVPFAGCPELGISTGHIVKMTFMPADFNPLENTPQLVEFESHPLFFK